VPCEQGTPRSTAFRCEAQIVRSITGISINRTADYVETGVRDGYCDLVRNAESFVYIENQYFIGKDGSEPLMNAIVGRIARAHEVSAITLMCFPTKLFILFNQGKEALYYSCGVTCSARQWGCK